MLQYSNKRNNELLKHGHETLYLMNRVGGKREGGDKEEERATRRKREGGEREDELGIEEERERGVR